MKDWKNFSFEIEEEDMLEALEKGEWESDENLTSRKEELRSFFQNNLDQETINAPLSNEDLELIKN